MDSISPDIMDFDGLDSGLAKLFGLDNIDYGVQLVNPDAPQATVYMQPVAISPPLYQ